MNLATPCREIDHDAYFFNLRGTGNRGLKWPMKAWRGPPISPLHVGDGEALHLPINDALAQVNPVTLGLLLRCIEDLGGELTRFDPAVRPNGDHNAELPFLPFRRVVRGRLDRIPLIEHCRTHTSRPRSGLRVPDGVNLRYGRIDLRIRWASTYVIAIFRPYVLGLDHRRLVTWLLRQYPFFAILPKHDP